jgi:hypothetical protein
MAIRICIPLTDLHEIHQEVAGRSAGTVGQGPVRNPGRPGKDRQCP